ncbi:MAG: EVE domain-containing protein [Thermodesulfobacteriota bacterium]
MKYWLVKSEPFKYSWQEFLKDGWTYWDGVRNYQARNNMKEMKIGDMVLYYHSNEGLEVVGIANVIKEFYQDPTTDDDRWVVVDIKPVETLKNPVSLKTIRENKKLKNIALVKQGRLSVMQLKKAEYELIVKIGQ